MVHAVRHHHQAPHLVFTYSLFSLCFGLLAYAPLLLSVVADSGEGKKYPFQNDAVWGRILSCWATDWARFWGFIFSMGWVHYFGPNWFFFE